MVLDMAEKTDEVVKNYRKALQRVVDEEDSHLDEMPDDATLQIIDQVLYTYSGEMTEEIGKEFDELEDRIDELEEILKNHFHKESGELAVEVE